MASVCKLETLIGLLRTTRINTYEYIYVKGCDREDWMEHEDTYGVVIDTKCAQIVGNGSLTLFFLRTARLRGLKDLF